MGVQYYVDVAVITGAGKMKSIRELLIITTLLTATVPLPGGIADDTAGLGETNFQTENKNDDLDQHDPLRLLPGFYLDAAKELELSSEQIAEIAQQHETYLLDTRLKQEDYDEKLRMLHYERQKAEQNNRRSDVKKCNEAIRKLITTRELLQNRRYAELQKAIMGILPSEKRKKWAGMLFASKAIRPFRWVMEKEQVQKIYSMCVRNEKIAKIKTLKRWTTMLREFRKRVRKEILTDEQRTKLWIASYETDKRKKSGKTIPEKNSDQDQQGSSGGKDSDRQSDSDRNTDKPETSSKVQKQKERSHDEQPDGAGGW